MIQNLAFYVLEQVKRPATVFGVRRLQPFQGLLALYQVRLLASKECGGF